MTHCVVILPDLLTVPEQVAADLRLPALENLLQRGKSVRVSDRCAEQSLMRHFGYKMPDLTSMPAAKIRWAGEFDKPAPEFCVCADPVHMLADIDHARLMDASALNLSHAEAEGFTSALNTVFTPDGLEFVFASPDSWYLIGEDASMLKTLPVKTLVGRNVASFLPEGDESAGWRTLSTEIQMLLFSNALNQARESQDQLPVNALWIWGGGHYESPLRRPPAHCYANDAFCRGLARLNNIPFDDLSRRDFDSVGKDSLLVMDGSGAQTVAYAQYTDWAAWITGLEESLFKPLLGALKKGQFEKLTLNVGNGREYIIAASWFYPFWRKRKPLGSEVSEKTVELIEW